MQGWYLKAEADVRTAQKFGSVSPHLLLRAAEKAQNLRVVCYGLIEAVVIALHHIIDQLLHPFVLFPQLQIWQS